MGTKSNNTDQKPKTSRLRRAAGALVNLLIAVVMLGALVFVAPAALGYERFVISGESMSGTYDLGSVVFEEVVPVEELAVGDVITYMPPPEAGIPHLVTHRIHSIRDGVIQTKGDAVADVDPWTFKLGSANQPRVTYSVPYLGWVLMGLQDRSLRMLLIGVPAGGIALLSLVQLAGALRRRPTDNTTDDATKDTTVVDFPAPTQTAVRGPTRASALIGA